MNKNTRQLRDLQAKARRAGGSSVTVEVPVSNYHSATKDGKPVLMAKTHPVTRGSDVVSENRRRNMRERILRNSGGGNNSSATVHEPIHKDRPVVYLNHAYIHKYDRYFQPTQPQPVA